MFKKIKIIDISNKAGLGKGNVYEYFAAKEEILDECCRNIINKNINILSPPNFQNLDFKDSFIYLISTICGIFKQQYNFSSKTFFGDTDI
ncbi:MAG: TetR/AcrR family transcriptional regulator, partial [Bacilli bacterium]